LRVETVHLGKELIERLLALVIGAEAGIALFTDGVYFVYENYAGRFFIGLLEKVAHLCRAHAHEHLNEFGAGNGEEGHLCFARNGPGQQRFTRARRANEQRALGQLCAYFGVLCRLMQKVDYLLQCVLGLVLARNVGKGFAGLRLNIYLGIGLAEAHRVANCAAVRHAAHYQLAYKAEYENGQHP